MGDEHFGYFMWMGLKTETLAIRRFMYSIGQANKLMELGEALELIDRSREVLAKESNILHIEVRLFCVFVAQDL